MRKTQKFLCGYVIILEEHFLYGKEIDEIPEEIMTVSEEVPRLVFLDGVPVCAQGVKVLPEASIGTPVSAMHREEVIPGSLGAPLPVPKGEEENGIPLLFSRKPE